MYYLTFSAVAIVFSKNLEKNFWPEKVKKRASKIAHNWPRPFYFTVQTTAHSPELIFHIMKSRDQTSVLLSVLYPPTVKLILFFCPIQPPESTATIYATWTPKHNGVLKTCMASGAQKEVETDQEYLARIVKSWRSKFPKSSVLGENSFMVKFRTHCYFIRLNPERISPF